MSKYHNDQPINGHLNDPDLLNRSSFANHLAETLLLDSDDDCLTVSLEGEWGYGKTSVINLVKAALSEKDKIPIIVEYNPWLSGNPDSLIEDFLVQLSSKLGSTNKAEIALKTGKELIAYSKLFSVAKLIPGAEPWATIIESVFSATGDAAGKISDLKKLDILGQKNKVSEALRKIESPIIIIIDDIDRLTPEETFQVLRLVKAVADFPGTSFLLAFDANYLTDVLTKNDIVNTSEYINKVIQLRVPLPIISDIGMNQLANVELDRLAKFNLTDRFDKDEERLSWIYHKYFIRIMRNPRDLKRFFNHLRFVLEQIEGQVSFTDLFVLSILATKANTVYEHIKRSPSAYIGRNLSVSNLEFDKPKDVIESYSEEREGLLTIFDKQDKELILGILKEVFPLLNGDLDVTMHQTRTPDAAGRISSPQRLHIALHSKTPSGYISDDEILRFISGETDREAFVGYVFSNQAEGRFFEMMKNYTKKCQHHSFDILICIYDQTFSTEKFRASGDRHYSFMIGDLFQEMKWLTNKIISEVDNKYDLIKQLISRERNSPIGADLLNTLRGQHKEDHYGDVWIDEKQLKEMNDIFQTVAIATLTNKSFLDTHLESHIFFELRRTSNEKAAEYISSELAEERGIIRVVEIIGRLGSDSVNGPYAKISGDVYSSFVDLDALKKEAEKIDIDAQPNRIRAAILSILDGHKYYLNDGSKATHEDT